MSGLLVAGVYVDVPSRKVLGPADDARIKCVAYKRGHAPHQWIVHKTIADDPEQILEGAGPAGGALASILCWGEEKSYDGAHLITDDNGDTLQTVDLATMCTNHATASNGFSVGHEIKEHFGGKSYRAALEGAVDVVLVGCEALGIQPQMQKRGTYTGHPIARMNEHGATPGGPDMIGIFPHRLNTERRGKWDCGEVFWDLLADRGVPEFDFAKREDIAFWMTVQQDLGARKFYAGPIDGIPGAGTTAALKLAGYRSGLYMFGRG